MVSPQVRKLIDDTATRWGIKPDSLEVFLRKFVRLANDNLEERIGFHTRPARTACAILSQFIGVPIERDLPKGCAEFRTEGQ